jgi:hypothetical protein
MAIGRQVIAASGFLLLAAAFTPGTSPPAHAGPACGQGEYGCSTDCGPWNNWCRPPCGDWNGWCANPLPWELRFMTPQGYFADPWKWYGRDAWDNAPPGGKWQGRAHRPKAKPNAGRGTKAKGKYTATGKKKAERD